jgi:predicted transcriptional regulator
MAETTRTAERLQIHAFIDRDVQQRLADLARRRDRSVSAEVRQALAAHVEREQSTERAE